MKKLLLLLLCIAALGTGCSNLSQVQQQATHTEASVDAPAVLSARQWKHLARKCGIDPATGKSSKPVTVLGHYPEYVELTEQLGAQSMQIPMDRWNAMTPEEQWLTNAGFLDSMARSGNNFRLATPVEKARPGSYYVRELNHLFGKGYKLSPDGLWLVK